MHTRPNSIFPRPCRTCGVVKSEEDFSSYPWNGQRYHRSACKSCNKIYDDARIREYVPYAQLSEEEKQKRRDSTARKRDAAREEGICIRCYAVSAKGDSSFCQSCLDIRNEENAERHVKLRQTVLDHYGHSCVCCPKGTQHPDEFLTFDHVGGWGKRHRIQSGTRISGASLFRWIIKNNFPDSIRILCYNCNCSLGHRGFCPHELNRSDISYLGQEFFHLHNPNIARAERNWRAAHLN